MNKKLLITIFSVLSIGLFALPAIAQAPLTAQVDRTDITSDDVVILTVTIDESNGRSSEPQLGVLDGFAVQGRSSSTQISIINGSSSRQASYQYSLVPTRLGTLTIDPVTAVVGGQQYATEPILVTVTQGNGQPSAPPPSSQSPFGTMPGMGNLGGLGNMPTLGSLLGNLGAMGSATGSASGRTAVTPTEDPAPAPPDLAGHAFYVEAEIDNATPYQGEQVVYTFRFYQAENLYDQPSYAPPSFTGFWSVDTDGQTEHRVEAGGYTYRVTQIQTILFPTVVDQLVIDAAELSVPGDFFTQGMSLKTEPLTVNVKPLPENAPAGFNGAVGQLTVQAAVDTQQTSVNDTVNWLLRLSGAGNIEQLPEPIWPEGGEWRAFDSTSTTETEFAANTLVGSKVYERVMIPTTPGELTLPAIEYVYFNPQTEQYETAVSDPILITATGDSSVSSNAVAPAAASNGDAAIGNSALRPLKPAAAISGSAAAPLTQQAGYWALWLVPLFVLGGSVASSRYRRHRAAGADERHKQQARGQAVRALKQARKNKLPAAEAGKILTAYLSAKLNVQAAGMTQTAVGSLLQSRGADEALAARAQSCLNASEMGRYAPSDLNDVDSALLAETEQLINDLDAVLH